MPVLQDLITMTVRSEGIKFAGMIRSGQVLLAGVHTRGERHCCWPSATSLHPPGLQEGSLSGSQGWAADASGLPGGEGARVVGELVQLRLIRLVQPGGAEFYI